jgi:di/tricarboxylate transporter
VTNGLTSSLFSSLPGWSGRMTSHSNLSAAAVEAIVLIPVTLVGIVLKLRWKVRERRDMSDLRNKRGRSVFRGGRWDVIVELAVSLMDGGVVRMI